MKQKLVTPELWREFKRIRENMTRTADQAFAIARWSLHFNKRHGIK
jgi:hypothetical protein